jgi:hypothetical protein
VLQAIWAAASPHGMALLISSSNSKENFVGSTLCCRASATRHTAACCVLLLPGGGVLATGHLGPRAISAVVLRRALSHQSHRDAASGSQPRPSVW